MNPFYGATPEMFLYSTLFFTFVSVVMAGLMVKIALSVGNETK